MSALFLPIVFAAGGGLGAVARHHLSLVVSHRLPLSTLLVNVLGSFLLGLILSLLVSNDLALAEHWTQLALGFCGGFTTFSSFAYQTLTLRTQYTWLHAVSNVVINMVLCLGAFWLGGVAVL